MGRIGSTDTQTPLYIMAETFTSDNKERVDAKKEKFILKLLSLISSWDELINTVLPISDNYRNIENKEDYYCVVLVRSFIEKMLMAGYHN